MADKRTSSRPSSTPEQQTDALLRSLECRLCQDRFTCPKECSCGHVFCLECLEDYHEKNDFKPVLQCPLCRRPTVIPKAGLDGLPTHLFYQDLCKQVSVLEKDNKLSRVSCKFCDDNEKLPATVKCMACQVPMCEDCSSNHVHNGVTNVVQMHRKQDSLLNDILPKRDTACNIHPTESLLLYCVPCKSCVCFKCKDEKHSDHEVADLADSAMPARSAIVDIQTRLKEYLNETKEALSDIDRLKIACTESVLATERLIEKEVQMLIDHLMKEKKRMIDELHNHAKDIERRLEQCHQEFEEKDLRAKTMMNLSENLMMYGNDAENTTYINTVETRWAEIQEEKLNRLGQGYKINVQFYFNDGLRSVLSKDLGVLRFSQNLSPWTSRKSVPAIIPPISNGSVDVSILHQKVRMAMSNDFSLRRSPIFARFVDPKWSLETYKTCSTTGQTVTVWLRVDEEQEQLSRASKRLSMRSYSAPCVIAEIDSFNEKGEHEYKKCIEKLPDGTILRLSIGGKDTIMLAVYPGLYASSVIGQSKLRSLSKKDVDGIYVAIFEKGQFICGELRKVPIPEGPGFDFDITTRGVIVLKSVLSPDVKVYSTKCQEVVTNHGQQGLSVKKIMESSDNGITVISTDTEGNVICESLADDGERETLFQFPANFLSPLTFEFKEARFDRNGNIIFLFKAGPQDITYLVTSDSERKEHLSKPEMLHKVDKLAVLPDGRICVFDKTECILMTLRYV